MNKDEVIERAAAVMKKDSLAHTVSFEGVTAIFIDGKRAMEEERTQRPHMIFKFEPKDFWMVTFPFLEEDWDQRLGIVVRVDPQTGHAAIFEVRRDI
jgi:hypothetical protein